ncbi:MAG: cytochrome c [Myxococcales bacterium]|nr:cytochrome c [Myxococcales bacterium]MCB9705315.1 cytochrome c [Myxococcales bacterium]
MTRFNALNVALALGLLAGCQGNRSDQPPVHIFQNMDFQKRFEAQEVNDFYYAVDCPEEAAAYDEAKAKALEEHGEEEPIFVKKCFGRAMRTPPAGTVAVGHLKDDDHYFRGRGPDGRLIDALPPQVELNEALLKRGEERYNIYCQPCHDYVGNGQGVATLRGGGFKVQPPSYHTEKLRAMPLGYFYKVISEGQGTMLSYASQIPVEDRWAIAAWVRTLQVSRQSKGGK